MRKFKLTKLRNAGRNVSSGFFFMSFRSIYRSLPVVASLALAMSAPNAHAVTLYKLVDVDGKVTYAELPPHDYHGRMIPMDIDVQTSAAQVTKATTPAPEQAAPKAEKPEPDYLSRRRATRAALDARLKRARDRLEAAKAALANLTMQEDDVRIVMKEVKEKTRSDTRPPGSPDPRMRPGCKDLFANGRHKYMCPGGAPNENFIARASALEEEVKQAEDEVEEAEVAYRKGVD
jgi:hypothetical protein